MREISNPTESLEATAAAESGSSVNGSPRIFSLALWDLFGRFGNLFITFGVSIFLARLIAPADFGAFGIVVTITTISAIVVDSGFRQAIVQRQNIAQIQLSTVFYLSITVAVTVAAAFSLSSVFVENFYAIPGLSGYIIVSSTVLVLNATMIVPGGLLQRHLKLRSISVVTMSSGLVSGTVSIAMAVKGYGVWALVTQLVCSNVLLAAGLFAVSKWTPSLNFSLSSIREIWTYSSNLLASSVVYQIATRLDIFVIGRLFPLETLGFYTRAQGLDSVVRNLSSGTTSAIIFPTFARIQDDIDLTRKFYIRALHFISFVAFFVSGLLFLTSADLIVLLFGERWAPAGDFFRVMAVTAFVYPLLTLMVNVITARGKSLVVLKIAGFSVVFYVLVIPILFYSGVTAFLYSLALLNLVTLLMDALFVRGEIGVSLKHHFLVIIKYGIVTLAAGLCSFILNSMIEQIVVRLSVTVVVFSFTSILLQWLFRFEGLNELLFRIRPAILRFRDR